MLPDWDFGGDDAKRQEFVSWVWDELDRFAQISAGRVDMGVADLDWAAILRPGILKRPSGRPTRVDVGLNPMVWEFGLLRYMFRRYWPNRKRPIADPASAASIAVARCRKLPPRGQRTPDRQNVQRAREDELKLMLFAEWERGTKSPGRREAELDIAYLQTLPATRFAR
jgi:hypothetical protein